MNKILKILLVLATVISCASSSKDPKIENVENILEHAERTASFGGRRILEVSRSMIANQEIIVGACWDYINTVYVRAGYSADQRVTIFKSKLQGPYIQTDLVEPGDWLYFVNHSYRETEHSAIFVGWTDEEKKEALMISYVGGNKKKPATYKKYILTNIYNVIRTQD